MSLLAIELNDVGIRAARDGALLRNVDGEHDASPGCAWIRPGDLVTGVAAELRASRHPLQIDDRFWDRLDLEPVRPRDEHSPNRAEVACAHLAQLLGSILEPADELVMAVPAFYGTSELGILAGIALELSLPLRGFVVGPIAFEAASDRAGAIIVVDLYLHRTVLSVVARDGACTLTRSSECRDVGLHALRRQWLKAIGEEFVRQTRFDPMHDAASEQQLSERLPSILDAVQSGQDVPVELEAGSSVHRVTVTEPMLAQSGHRLVHRLVDELQSLVAEERATAVVLAHETARVPGLARMVDRQINPPVETLPPGAAALGLCTHWTECFDRSAAPAVAYHTSRGAAANAPPPPTTAPSPTHLLVGGEALPLSRRPLHLEIDEESGQLRISASAGVASLRPQGIEIVLEVRPGADVEVDGRAAEGERTVAVGTEIGIPGSRETLKLIALRG